MEALPPGPFFIRPLSSKLVERAAICTNPIAEIKCGVPPRGATP